VPVGPNTNFAVYRRYGVLTIFGNTFKSPQMQIVKSLAGILLWSVIIIFSTYFFLDDVWTFVYGYRSKTFGETLFNNQVWVVAHLVGGSLALLIGPVQFWKWFRDRYINIHRFLGKIYIAGCFLTGLSALRLSMVSTCAPCRISLFITAILLLFTTGAAWFTIKQRNVKAHRQFMVRSYVLILAFVLVRIDGIYSLQFMFGEIKDGTFNRVVNEYFFSFFPLIVAEIGLTWIPTLRRRLAPKK
jgi:uncharacterized membrane protein